MTEIENRAESCVAQNAITLSENTVNPIFFSLQAACSSENPENLVKNTFICEHYA